MMNDETMDHLHAYVRHMYVSGSVETVFGALVKFFDGCDEDDRAYYLNAGWPTMERAAYLEIGTALIAAGR